MGPLRWAFKTIQDFAVVHSQLISVPAQFCRAIAKLIEKLDNAPKMFQRMQI